MAKSRRLVRNAGGVQGVELVSGALAPHDFPRHFHDEVVVTVVTRGEERIVLKDRALSARAGSVIVLAPGEVHANEPASDGFSYRSFFLSPDLFEGPELEAIHRSGACDLGPTGLGARLAALHRELEEEEDSRLLVMELLRLVSRLALSAPERGRELEEGRVERARRLLEQDPAGAIPLQKLASNAGASPWYLQRLFRRSVGCSPHEYQTLLRLSLARRLLAEGLPIADAAAEAGFSDQAHLTRLFSRHFGFTPGEFRARSFKTGLR